jgi:hypothetical protein
MTTLWLNGDGNSGINHVWNAKGDAVTSGSTHATLD